MPLRKRTSIALIINRVLDIHCTSNQATSLGPSLLPSLTEFPSLCSVSVLCSHPGNVGSQYRVLGTASCAL